MDEMAESPFADPDAADRSRERLQRQFHRDIVGWIEPRLQHVPSPDLALANFERWLQGVSNPATLFDFLDQYPEIAAVLVQILGSSRSLSDVLVQNPELADIVVDPAVLTLAPKAEKVLAEARGMVEQAISDSHALDRLRYLKQRWTLGIAVNDLTGNWNQQSVWRAISDLADGLIAAAREATWARYCREKELSAPCPIHVIGMGKLGGHELNYSSDVDLVFILDDDVPDRMEPHAIRFAEMLSRSLADRMSRGMLYRVDLRLRPFGSTGPIVNRMRAVEAYYNAHAEPWEHLALIRSRMVSGSSDLATRWEDMRLATCFLPQRGEWMVEEWLNQRERMEELSSPGDLKRGRGGIRDIEFLTQIFQALHGRRVPTVQCRSTLEALAGLRDAGLLTDSDAGLLTGNYTWLRQCEHRIQLVSDNQTHEVPKSPTELEMLRRSLAFASCDDLHVSLETRREETREVYERLLSTNHGCTEKREVLRRLGADAGPITKWIDALYEPDAFYRSIHENESSLDRIRIIAERTPALIEDFQRNPELTEAIISGEIEEWSGISDRIEAAGTLEEVAATFVRIRDRLAAQWVLDPSFDLGERLSDLMDATLLQLARAAGLQSDIVALGSLAAQEATFGSDADVLLIVSGEAEQREMEVAAQRFVDLAGQLRRRGADFGIDLRLRPDGRKGLLVRTYNALQVYASTEMENWERFALCRFRTIRGEHAAGAIDQVLRAEPWSQAVLEDLLSMKQRIETERVPPHLRRRHVKLGEGGLGDIEWLTQLLVMSLLSTMPVPEPKTADRIRMLLGRMLINAVEADALMAAHSHLVAVRHHLRLLGFEADIIPENPEKQSHLAASLGLGNGYEFMRRHEEARSGVRMIFDETVARLRS
ncbi:MAG: Glutamate-ammonia-ligase adenylyltransferase [Fimbriimonadaceae bacterium]|nr:Glutamate-ammonia-ligase adenylyltransferase [Fimbriimonadaceae bacterium]